MKTTTSNQAYIDGLPLWKVMVMDGRVSPMTCDEYSEWLQTGNWSLGFLKITAPTEEDALLIYQEWEKDPDHGMDFIKWTRR